MDSRAVRRLAGIMCGVLFFGLAVLGLGAVFAYSAEYSGDTGVQMLPLVVGLVGGTAALSVWVWPALRWQVRIGGPAAVILATAMAGFVAAEAGDLVHEPGAVGHAPPGTSA